MSKTLTDTRQLTDQASRDRIVSALDRNVLVEAGAGSGKTHMMAARMAAGIAGGVYQVEQMAAVTFTRKAAAELRGRFQLALEAELASSNVGRDFSPAESTARVQRIRAALSNLERFFAGTIHSFCAHLLRERPVEAGVSPDFTELDETEDSLLRKQVWRDFLVQGRASGNPLIQELKDAGLKPKELDDAFDTIALYAEVDFPPGDAQRPETAAVWAALDAFWAALKAKLPPTIPPDATCRTQQTAQRFVGQMRIAALHRDRPSVLAGLLETWDFTPGITQWCWSDDRATGKRLKAEIEQLHGDFRTGAIEPFLDEWRQYLYRLTVTLLAEARHYATAERRRRNTLNYGDLLQLAAEVLRGNADVRRALQSKCRWLFVDEFQDTDPVQAEIIFLLAASDGVRGQETTEALAKVVEASPKAVDWRALPLRPGALFVVGDPKQSIYRFRRADIEIYNTVRARLDDPPVSEVLSLTTNFRSVPALCDFANNVFQTKFPKEATAQSPKFAPLDKHRPEGEDVAGEVWTLTTPADCEQRDIPTNEAERIARYVCAEVDAGRRSFGDFLVLTRKRKNLSTYAEALERLQVPIEVSGAGAFGKSPEVAQLALLLRALSDPQDAVSLVGVLRGPLFGISDPELFAWKRAGGWFSIFTGVGRDFSPGAPATLSLPFDPVADALKDLSEYFHLTRVLPAAAALERILEHSGYLALAATTPGGVEAGDLLHAVDRVRQVVADGASLADAAEALEADREASSEVESLPLEPGRSDVVRVMNLHKAKGLEAAVVFLVDPCGGFKPKVDIRIIRDGSARDGLGARGYFSITREAGWKKIVMAEPAGWDTYEAEERQYLDAEESRLLYVAATRARDALVVSRWARGGGRAPAWAALSPLPATAKELPTPSVVAQPAAATVDLSDARRNRADAARQTVHERASVTSWSATSVTAEAKHIVAIARSADLPEPAPDDPTRVVSTDTPSRRADAGTAWGTLIHALLEHAMRQKAATREDLRRLAMWLTIEHPELRPVIDTALDTIAFVAQASFWDEAKASPERHEEVPFARRLTTENSMQVMNGTIDLVYKRPSDWRLLDYKTDSHATTDDLRARYRQQLDAYAEAWGSLAGGGVVAELVATRR
jgi:ATP-dependent helicase/nuclease subunit A